MYFKSSEHYAENLGHHNFKFMFFAYDLKNVAPLTYNEFIRSFSLHGTKYTRTGVFSNPSAPLKMRHKRIYSDVQELTFVPCTKSQLPSDVVEFLEDQSSTVKIE